MRLFCHLTAAAFLGMSACAGVLPDSPDPIEEGDDDVKQGPLAPGKIAVVFAHGFGGTADSWDPAISTAIEADGHAVLRASVPSVEGVEERAAALVPQIDPFLAATGATQVHIIAHSMGGLDARYAISSLGLAPKVASLTTISTPHAGTPLADVALGIREGDQAGALEALEALAEAVGLIEPGALDRALVDLSEANAPTFNAANADIAGVIYQSYAGLSTPNGIENPNAAALCGVMDADALRAMLYIPAVIVANGFDRLPNDGVVGVASATYTGFQGCIAADHIDETGIPGLVPNTLDTPAFYKGIVAKLAP
jgi:triacylglycerol lipase